MSDDVAVFFFRIQAWQCDCRGFTAALREYTRGFTQTRPVIILYVPALICAERGLPSSSNLTHHYAFLPKESCGDFLFVMLHFHGGKIGDKDSLLPETFTQGSCNFLEIVFQYFSGCYMLWRGVIFYSCPLDFSHIYPDCSHLYLSIPPRKRVFHDDNHEIIHLTTPFSFIFSFVGFPGCV